MYRNELLDDILEMAKIMKDTKECLKSLIKWLFVIIFMYKHNLYLYSTLFYIYYLFYIYILYKIIFYIFYLLILFKCRIIVIH